MGTLFYGTDRVPVDIDDRALVHLQLAMVTKLRRHEGFAFSWRDEATGGQGRHTVWVHESTPLHFAYAGSRTPSINRAWIDALLATATTTPGMRLVDEPVDRPAARPSDATRTS